MQTYYVDVNPADNSVRSIAQDNLNLMLRFKELEIPDDTDLLRYILGEMDKDSDLFLIDGKLEIKKEPSKGKQLRDLRPKITKIQSDLWLQNIVREVVETGQPFETINQLRIKREEEHGALQNQRAKLEEEIQQAHDAAANREAWERIAKADYQFNNVICAIAKDETPYLLEWLTYHLDLGVEHIFLHDDGSAEPIRKTIEVLPEHYLERITITDDHLKHPWTTQRAVYTRWLKAWEGKVKWVSFLDMDEFLVLKKAKTVNEFLSGWPEDTGEINIGWVEYNAGGAVQKTSGPVRERFKAISPCTPYEKKFWMGKYFVRPEVVYRIRIHETTMAPGFKRVSPEGFEVKPCCTVSMERDAYPDPKECAAYVEHYFTKSYEEWMDKIKRGACDNYLRKRQEFFWHNPDLVEIDRSEQVYGE